ncbi:hypothetical protein Mgra_00005695 [Meloidogyne graminicola]|uniref:Uncharacterized protein n=1 Tax=Meloidogyne graminicola TaxID=189291 RepID=A0A8S9ZNU1_9BILA|nr:hypothetical protein Mgra_00005695 [Meloidogyne graminicola]
MQKMIHPFFVTLEVFRTLMASKPMMLASRGKKSAVLSSEYLPQLGEEENSGSRDGNGFFSEPSYWVVADGRLPIFALPLNVRR